MMCAGCSGCGVDTLARYPGGDHAEVPGPQHHEVRVRAVVQRPLGGEAEGGGGVERGGLQRLHHAAPRELGELGHTGLHRGHGAREGLK